MRTASSTWVLILVLLARSALTAPTLDRMDRRVIDIEDAAVSCTEPIGAASREVQDIRGVVSHYVIISLKAAVDVPIAQVCPQSV